MEMLNQVHVRGIVGNARVQKIGDTEMVRFSVATDHAYTNRSGKNVVEVTWFNCVAFQSVTNGAERTMMEVLASDLTVLGEVSETL